MTAQFADRIRVGHTTFYIAGVAGRPLFEPRAHGLEPSGWSTATYRGFICTYSTAAGQLRLKELVLGRGSKLNGARLPDDPVLFGQPGHLVDDDLAFAFRGLDVHVPFSGGLLLGDDFIRDLYVHMGFHPGWKYRSVLELILQRGRVVRQLDRSAEIARIREAIASGSMPHPDGTKEDIGQWIKRAFELDYTRTFGG